MVWDRLERGPAMLRGRQLVGLSREHAETALRQMIVDDPTAGAEFLITPETSWLVSYGRMVIGCRDEAEAKLLARDLLIKGNRVTAQTVDGFLPARFVAVEQIGKWLDER
jgi:hypothetical protein